MTAPETYEAKRGRIAATEYTDEQLSAIVSCYHGVEMVEGDDYGHCPHCGLHLSNGAWSVEDAETPQQRKGFIRQHECLGCGGQYGSLLKRTAGKIAKAVTAMKTTQQPSGKVKIVPNGKSFGLVDSKGAWVLAAPSKRPGYPTPLRLFRTEAGAAAWVKKATA
jgi:hypothetical protein